jgi:flagellar protein FlgJ
VAAQFEAMALAQFLQPMFATIDTSRSAFGGAGEAMFRPMLVEEMARGIAAQGGGIGIREAVLREILKMEGDG